MLKKHYLKSYSNTVQSSDPRSLLQAILADGRPLLLLSGLGLVFAGGFAIFLGLTGHFLPHDEHFLGMDAAQLCAYANCRIVHFMIHDRIAFGGALIACGALYLWLVEFPLRNHEGWAWWALMISVISGMTSFLTWINYGYLDTWHGIATLFLFPCFAIGLFRSYQTVRPASLWQTVYTAPTFRFGTGWVCLLLTVLGLFGAGIIIVIGGSTRVFVPQDLYFMQLTVSDLEAISPRLVPLIAHDRASFGGAILSVALTMGFCVWFAKPSKSLRQILWIAGSAGFGCAIGVHFLAGYHNLVHLLPAYAGALVFLLGMILLSKE